MCDVICVDDNYTPDTLSFWSKWGVNHPKKDKIYSLRDYQRHSTGDIGIRVNEIINPKVPIKHPVLGEVSVEPTFNYKRFRLLNGDLLTKEIIEEVIHEMG